MATAYLVLAARCKKPRLSSRGSMLRPIRSAGLPTERTFSPYMVSGPGCNQPEMFERRWLLSAVRSKAPLRHLV
jgi:hypothetical protein